MKENEENTNDSNIDNGNLNQSIIKTEEIFTLFKFEKIKNNFEDINSKIVDPKLSNGSTTISQIKTDYEKDAANLRKCSNLDSTNLNFEEENEESNLKENLNSGKSPIKEENQGNNQGDSNRNRYKILNKLKNDAESICSSDSLNNLKKHIETDDIIPLSYKIIYSLASFSKMSSLILLK